MQYSPDTSPADSPDPAHAASDVDPRATLGDILAGLLYRSHLLAPSDLGATIADQATLLGADETAVYLLDYGQTHLVPLPSPGAPDRAELSLEGSVAGRALRTYEPLESEGRDPGWRRLWVPLVDGTDRLGVLEFAFADDDLEAPRGEIAEDVREACRAYATLVAYLWKSKAAYGDAMEFVRRRGPLDLSAEIAWRMLPPLTFATEALVISGMLEPWQSVGGDSFDYAVNGDVAHVAVFDAMGHGLDAALLVSVALAGYRQSRQELLTLEETFANVDAAIKSHVGGERFVTALLAEITIPTGRLRWVSAGHPAPLLLRGGKLINRLELPASPPLGLSYDGAALSIGEEPLEPADRLLLYTDGVVEARTPDGEFFGLDRLGEFVVRECSSGAAAPEALRRLGRAILEHQQGQLQDDATTLLVEWTGGGERTLLL